MLLVSFEIHRPGETGTDHDYEAGRLQVNSKFWSVSRFLQNLAVPQQTIGGTVEKKLCKSGAISS